MEFRDRLIPGDLSLDDLAIVGRIDQFGQPPNRIAPLNRISGIDFDEAWKKREEATIRLGEGLVPVRYISLHHLIENKRAAGRGKDIDDLPYLDHS